MLILVPLWFVCVCPVTSLIALAIVTICYCLLLGIGAITWCDWLSQFQHLNGQGLMLIYAMFVAIAYIGVLKEIIRNGTRRETSMRQGTTGDDGVT